MWDLDIINATESVGIHWLCVNCLEIHNSSRWLQFVKKMISSLTTEE